MRACLVALEQLCFAVLREAERLVDDLETSVAHLTTEVGRLEDLLRGRGLYFLIPLKCSCLVFWLPVAFVAFCDFIRGSRSARDMTVFVISAETATDILLDLCNIVYYDCSDIRGMGGVAPEVGVLGQLVHFAWCFLGASPACWQASSADAVSRTLCFICASPMYSVCVCVCLSLVGAIIWLAAGFDSVCLCVCAFWCCCGCVT